MKFGILNLYKQDKHSIRERCCKARQICTFQHFSFNKQSVELLYKKGFITSGGQSELPRSILQKFVESDHGRTSMIYFNNAGDKVTLMYLT